MTTISLRMFYNFHDFYFNSLNHFNILSFDLNWYNYVLHDIIHS